MSKNTVFISLITLLVMAASYGVYSIFQQQKAVTQSNPLVQDTRQTNNYSSNSTSANTDIAQEFHSSEPISQRQMMAETALLLKQSQYTSAVELVDSLYHQLSTQELVEFDRLFIDSAYQLWQTNKSPQAIALLTDYNDRFNSLNGWTLLSNIHLKNQHWQASINALLKAVPLEHQPEKLAALMDNLVVAASSLRTLLEGQKDELGINNLYRNLHEHLPNNGRFQIELASSYLRLDDTNTARSLLESVQYDMEYGGIAKSLLSELENNLVTATEQLANNAPSRHEIIIPLQRSGNSLIANTIINNRQHQLLLDTGASITALSQATIESLKLKPTGRTILLSTANGMTQARLFRADQIKLGSLSLKNLVVAEIDFDKNSQIHGLLGTDLLNQLDRRYSYVIDNHKNALIFKSKIN